MRYLRFAEHIVVLQPHGEGAIQGSFDELRARDLLPDSEPIETCNEGKDRENTQDEPCSREAPKLDSLDKDAVDSSVVNISDKNVLGYYMKSMGFWHGSVFIILGALCIGLWKVSGTYAIAPWYLRTDLLRLLGSCLDRAQRKQPRQCKNAVLCRDIRIIEFYCLDSRIFLVWVRIVEAVFFGEYVLTI